MTNATLRGSRKHVMDWVQSSDFLASLNEIIAPSGATLSSDDFWMPTAADPMEARLERDGSKFAENFGWPLLANWWLKHHAGANTPNWDLISSATIGGKRGLILFEAKANVPELSEAGKKESAKPSARSAENCQQIIAALGEAEQALRAHAPDCRLSIDSHYQLSNRLAFAWKLASLGLPVVLVYLGFLNDEGITDVGASYESDAHWRAEFARHTDAIGASRLTSGPIHCGTATMQIVVASRSVLARSARR